MKHFAVIGNPIAHSRSPDIHHIFGRETGIALSYQKLLAPLDGFTEVMQAFFAGGGDGMNVTVPFKEQAFATAQVLTERAQAAGAVNTLWMADGSSTKLQHYVFTQVINELMHLTCMNST